MNACGRCARTFDVEVGSRKRRQCAAFDRLGYFPCWRAYILTDEELSDPEIIRNGRTSALRRGVSYRGMLDYLTDLLRDFGGVFVDRRSGAQVDLDMTPLEDAPVHWFRDLIRPCPTSVRPRTRVEGKERWRAALSILRATDPNGGMWGAARA